MLVLVMAAVVCHDGIVRRCCWKDGRKGDGTLYQWTFWVGVRNFSLGDRWSGVVGEIRNGEEDCGLRVCDEVGGRMGEWIEECLKTNNLI